MNASYAMPAALPPDAMLLHIGVPKTGTTAIQSALEAISPQLAEYGVSMPGTPLQQARGALSAVGAMVGFGGGGRTPYGPHHWVALLELVAAAQGRRFVSSEYFCEAKPAQVDRIVRDLQAYQPHVVITLRPLQKILPSAWQQYLKSGHQLPYEEWLHAVLDEPPRKDVTPSFWRRHNHGEVVSRWAARVGPERTIVMVLDPSDRDLIYRGFSSLLGLPPDLLAEIPDGRDNRSMTAAESELFRRLNVVLRDQRVAWDDYAHLVRYGAITRAVRNGAPPTPATALQTPDWALDRAEELGRSYVEAIIGSGAQVIGDLELLSMPAKPAEHVTGPVTEIPVEVAVEALLGSLARTLEGRSWFPLEDPAPGVVGSADSDEALTDAAHTEVSARHGQPIIRDSTPVGRLTTLQLTRVVNARIRRGLRRRWLTVKARRTR
jgi:hypothetical protein